MDLIFASKYPFSKEAREFISSRNMGLDYEAVEKAKRRVVEALKNGSIAPLEMRMAGGLENEIASYAISRMIVSLIKSNYFIGRYAIAEAKRASHYLREEDDEGLMKVAGELNIKSSIEGDYSMHFADYLRYSPRSVDYKLVNRRVSGGRVHLRKSEFVRVVEEAIKLMLYSQLPLRIEHVPEEVKKAVEEVRRQIPREEVVLAQPVKGEENYPPCIRKIIQEMRASVNVPHTGRWALTVYLANIGVKSDEIVKLFSTAPDYDEKVTRYQVDYIIKRGYKMPSCLSMDTYGLRINECPCIRDRRVKTPLRAKGGAFFGGS